MTRMVAIDPGRAKCGLVLVDVNRRLVLAGGVEPADQVNTVLQRWCRDEAGVNRILLGNGTSSADWQSRLQAMAPIELVEEAGTTLRARDRYWQLWPPRGWRRWIPPGTAAAPGRSGCAGRSGDARRRSGDQLPVGEERFPAQKRARTVKL